MLVVAADVELIVYVVDETLELELLLVGVDTRSFASVEITLNDRVALHS